MQLIIRNVKFLPKFSPSIWISTALTLLALVICAEHLFHPGYFTTYRDDSISYAYFIEVFRDYVADGIWYPRWMYKLYGGYGYPTFLLRQPGFWFFTLPFSWLVASPVVAFKLSGLAIVLLWLVALYKIARFFGATPLFAFAIVIVLILLVHPPTMVLVDWAGTAQCYAYTFSLWGMYFFLQLTKAIADKRRFFGSWGGLIIASTAALYTHPFIFAFYALTMAAIFIGQMIHYDTTDKRKILLISSAAAAIITLALSSPYWFTTWYFSDQVFYGRGIGGFLSPDASFARGEMTDRLYGNSIKTYFFYVFHWCFFPLIMAYVIYASKERPLYVAMTAIYLFCTFMMRPISLPIWHNVHFLSYLQYIWRFHYLRSMAAVIIMTQFAVMMSGYCKQKIYAWGLTGLLVTVCLLLYHPFSGGTSGINYDRTKFFFEKNGLVTFAGSDIFQPRTSSLAGLHNRFARNIPMVEMATKYAPGDVILALKPAPPWQDIHAMVEIKNIPATGVRLRINQFYFPGWEVTVNGTEIPFQTTTDNVHFDFADNGRIGLEFLAPGTYDIHATYAGPPYWQLRNMLMILVSGFTLLGFIGYYRKIKTRE